jgi:hypothetical protein
MKKKILIPLLLVIILQACVSSKITSTWKDQKVSFQKYNKIMVLGLIRDADRSLQERMENHMINDLKDLGYNAVSGLQEYGPKAFDNLTEEAALNKIKNSGVDAVITIVLLDKEKERYYVPGRIYYSPYGYYYNRFWGYRGTLYQRIDQPGYYVTDTKYFWESNLYDMGTQKLVYSAQTQSFDPKSSETLGHQYGLVLIKQMVKENVLQDSKVK